MVFRRVFGAALLLCLFSGTAVAVVPNAAFMPLGDAALQPFGHFNYCRENGADCAPLPGGGRKGPVALTPELTRLVASVNGAVNLEIRPASDRELYGREERWVLPASRGDCEDYALLKRARLHAAGIPLSDLLLTVVRKSDGTGHAVLTLRTKSGDFVLDNLDWRVLPWAQAPYTFLKRQSDRDPGRWVEIEAGADALVGSVTP